MALAGLIPPACRHPVTVVLVAVLGLTLMVVFTGEAAAVELPAL
jgi:hypothetical protein